jgi:GTP-binding protein
MISATYHSSAVNLDGLPKEKKPHVAMVGRSNVGKSSMINHLTARKSLARVSSKPGRTQTINMYEINEKFFLVDLPGYGFARQSVHQREKFADMILDYLKDSPHLKLVLLIIDARIPLSALDAEMLGWLQENNIPFVLIANKMDQLKRNDVVKLHAALAEKYPGVKVLEHSVDSAKNKNEIWHEIEKAVKK